MRKSLFIVLALALVASSCSVSKAAREQRNLISGTWNLDNARYENSSEALEAILFSDANILCFEGSNWFFRDNNSTGRYTLKQGSLCEGGDRYIRWSVQEPAAGGSQMQFKFIDADNKDISGGYGYRLDIAQLSPANMVLTTPSSVNGKRVTVVLEFSKVPESK